MRNACLMGPRGAIVVVLSVALAVLGSAACPPPASAAVEAPSLAQSRGPVSIIRFPVGGEEGQIGIERRPGEEAWGPSAFDIGPDGRLVVVDGVNGRLVIADLVSGRTKSLPFPDGVVSPVDVRWHSTGLYLLDTPAVPPTVTVLDEEGNQTGSWEVPVDAIEHAVTGLRVEDLGSRRSRVLLELDEAWEMSFLVAGARVPLTTVPTWRNGLVVDLQPGALARFGIGSAADSRTYTATKDWANLRSGAVRVSERGVPVRELPVASGTGTLGGVVLVDADKAGNAYIFAEEIADDGVVRGFVKKYGPDGAPRGSTEVPRGDVPAKPRRRLRVTPAGDVIALLSDGGSSRLAVLALAPDSDGVLTASGPERTSEEPSSEGRVAQEQAEASGFWGFLREIMGPSPAAAAWTPLNAYDRAKEYTGNSWYCGKSNYYPDGDNTRPRYITAYNKNWVSVPYCWGGWDTKSSFNSDMTDGQDAGNINTTGGFRSWTAGTDCSGLVSRLWGLGSKRNTSTNSTYGLASSTISTYIDVPGRRKEQLGDAYIKIGTHAMFVDYVNTSGARVFESTTSNKYDRVVHVMRSWSELSGYGVYRYNNWK